VAGLVVQRTHEVGVRVALGAERTDVLRLIVGEAARLVAVGGVIGIVAALALTRLLRSLLSGVQPTDLATFLIAPLVLGIVALLAAALPARRATQVDPMVALRYAEVSGAGCPVPGARDGTSAHGHQHLAPR